jgi:hypothetical protein
VRRGSSFNVGGHLAVSSAYRTSAKLDPNLSGERLAGRCPLSGLWCIYILPDVLGSFDLTHMGPGVRGRGIRRNALNL